MANQDMNPFASITLKLFSYLAAAALAVALWGGWRSGALPGVLIKAYACASILSFVAYTIDKGSAVGRRRRLGERSLLLLDVAGGWPGGVIAQQLLRHKTSKISYQGWFWCAVVINVCALAAYWWHIP